MVRKLTVAFSVVTLTISALSGCSTAEEVSHSQSEDWELPGYDETLINEKYKDTGPLLESDKYEDSSLSVIEVELVADVMDRILDHLASHPVTSANVFEQVGLSPNQIIFEGAGDEATAEVLASALPMDLIDSNAPLEDRLIGYAYLLKISSLFAAGSGIPAEMSVAPRAIEVVSNRELLIPSGGEAISVSRFDEDNIVPMAYIVSTPFTLTLMEKGSSNDGTHNRWGLNIAKLAESALEIGETPEEIARKGVTTDYE